MIIAVRFRIDRPDKVPYAGCAAISDLKAVIDLRTVYPAHGDTMMDVVVLGAGFSGSLAATRLSCQGFIDRQALHNVIVPIDADLQPIGILLLHRTGTLGGHT